MALPAAAVVAIVAAVAKGVSDFVGGNTALGALKDTNKENLRRLRERNKQLLGVATARAGASGVEMEGSLSEYLDAMKKELARQEKWTKQHGGLEERAAKFAMFGLGAQNVAKGVNDYGNATGWGVESGSK
jgi:hypothetical protein